MAEHSSQLHQAALLKDMPVKALPALKMKTFFGICVRMPVIFPTSTGSMPEAEGKELLHDRHEPAVPCRFLKGARSQLLPHLSGNDTEGFLLGPVMLLQDLIQRDGRENLGDMLIVSLVTPSFFLFRQDVYSTVNILPDFRGQCRKVFPAAVDGRPVFQACTLSWVCTSLSALEDPNAIHIPDRMTPHQLQSGNRFHDTLV